MMKICSIGNQICVAQDLKLYACLVCVCFYMYECMCVYIYMLAKFKNLYEHASLHTLVGWFFFFHLDFICEYSKDLIVPSSLILNMTGVSWKWKKINLHNFYILVYQKWKFKNFHFKNTGMQKLWVLWQ